MNSQGKDSASQSNAPESAIRALPAPWWQQLLFWSLLALISPLLVFILLTTVFSSVTFLVIYWPFGILFIICFFLFISLFETP